MAKKSTSNKKRLVKVEAVGQAHVHSSFNNIIISLTNNSGKVAFDLGMRKAKVYVTGPGNGRESAIRSIHASGIEVAEIIDVTPLPHNGCRPPKRRRV